MRTAAAFLVLMVLASSGAAQSEAPARVDLQGKLYKSVFSGGAGGLTPADLGGVPEPLRARLARYLERRAGFKSRYASEPDTLEKMRADAKRRALERSIVALLEIPGVEKMAASLMAAAPIAHEWNRLPDRPLAEASFAEEVLKKDPASALAPWLYVFIAERQRIAFETYESQKDEEGMRAAAKKYRTFVERARAVDDPIFPALVEDMERLPYLYLEATTHPREYAPDS